MVGAVGTVGAAPVLAVRLRQELEARWPQRLGGLVRLMAALRPAVREAAADWGERRRILAALTSGPWADAALAGDADEAERRAREALASGGLAGEAGGRVTLVEAPSDPDLMTVRAARVLGSADRLVLAGPVEHPLLAFARRDAPRTPWAGGAAPLRGWVEEGELVAVVGRTAPVAAALEAAGLPFARA